MAKSTKKTSPPPEQKRRQYLSQADVPSYGMEEALRVPRAIQDNYGGKPVTPIQLARALDNLPTSGSFRMLCGASIAYGLTDGGYNAPEIKLTPLAQRIVRPTKEDDDLAAKREALLIPRVVGEFLRKYDSAPIPRDDIGRNVLIDMGVPSDRAEDVFKLIVESAESLGLISDIKGKKYVDLKGAGAAPAAEEVSEGGEIPPEDRVQTPHADKPASSLPPKTQVTTGIEEFRRRRVFITHGKDKSFVEPIKKLLSFGELEPVVAVERQSVSQPVPDKVMNDMRSCGAAIIHVDAEQRVVDKEAKEHIVLNPNVLIEIGAAMALFGRRFILLVKSGITLPSNLQGLFEVRYEGDTLGGDATIKLLEAINDMKSKPFPEEMTSDKA
jgi:predicted nucleotide-binding protein